jgi:hypothetical protein
VKRNTFVICAASKTVNAAAEYYKDMMCEPGAGANREKSLNIFANAK